MDKLKPVVNISLGDNVELHKHQEVIDNYNDLVAISGDVVTNTNDIDQIINGDITMYGEKSIYGDVIVHGSFYALSAVIITTEELALSSNFIDLNNNWTTGAPIEDAGIRVIRGDEPNAELRWDETDDVWKHGVSGSLTEIGNQSDIRWLCC